MDVQLKNKIRNILENDGVIAFVTDTVWGLGCLPESEKAVRRKEHQIQRMYKQQEEEKRELIQLREEKFLVDKGKKEYYTKTQQ